MKKLIFMFVMGLMVCLLSSCEVETNDEKTKTINGQKVCFVEKYGVSFMDCRDGNYLFKSKVSTVENKIIDCILARRMFEKEHPELELVSSYSPADYGEYLVAIYRLKPSTIVLDPDVIIGTKVVGKLSEFVSKDEDSQEGVVEKNVGEISEE